jgi:hypothetical protein
MARTHGRIYSRIWEGDFRALTRGAQWMYEFLLSQADLNQAGLIGLRLRRWAGMAADVTPDELIRDLEELEAARWVVVDWDEEEVLIRTFLRNDLVYKQPNVMLAAGNDAREIASPKLRAALLLELDRIPLDELSDEVKGSGGRSSRAIVEGVIEVLRKSFGDLPATHPSIPAPPLPKGSGNPSGGVPGTPPVRVSPSPSPTPTGSAPTVRAAEPPGAAPSTDPGEAHRPTPTPSPAPVGRETEGQRVNRLAKVFTDLVPMSNFPAVAGIVRKAVKAAPKGVPLYDDTQIEDGLRRLAGDGRPLTVDTLRIELDGLPPRTPRQRESTEDRMAAVQALKRGNGQPTNQQMAIGG